MLCSKGQEVEVKMDGLMLVEFILEGVGSKCHGVGKELLKEVLIPSAIWRVGKA